MVQSSQNSNSPNASPTGRLKGGRSSDDLTRFNKSGTDPECKVRPETIPLSKSSERKQDNTPTVANPHDDVTIQMDTKGQPASRNLGHFLRHAQNPSLSIKDGSERAWNSVCGPNAKKIFCWLGMFVFMWITFILVLNIQKKVIVEFKQYIPITINLSQKLLRN